MEEYGVSKGKHNIGEMVSSVVGNIDRSSSYNAPPHHITTQITQIHSEYYTENNKRAVFGKNEQKKELAENICNSVGIDNMLKHTMWIIPYTNRVYFDYHMFKMFAHPNNYCIIVEEVMKLCKQCISLYGSFSVHVNLLGFSVSAVNRYKGVIELFCGQCLANNENYSDYLEYINVYNTPHFIENVSHILGGLIPPHVKSKVVKLNKQNSAIALNTLFSANEPDTNSHGHDGGHGHTQKHQNAP